MSADPRLRARQNNVVPVPPPPPPPAEPQPVTDNSNNVPATQQPAPTQVPDDHFKLKFCTVCASNQNRYAQFIPCYPLPATY